MSRLSRPYDKTFKTQTLGAIMQLGSQTRSDATLGATLVQIFQTLSRLSRLRLSARLCNLGLNPDAARPLARVIPDFLDLMTRLSMFKLSARLCNLRPNPDAAQLMHRLSRPSVQTFQTQTLGTNLQFGSKAGCGTTLGATLVQIFQTLCPDFPD